MLEQLTPEQDNLQVPPERPRNWSENAVCIFNAPDSGLAIYTHFSRVAPDPRVWEGILTVYLPDDELLVSRSFAASRDAQVADAGALRFTCVEPLELWRLEFDGLARRVKAVDLATSFLSDGSAEPVAIDLEMRGVRPVWSPGHVPDQSWGDFHLEQECAIEGTITVGGEDIAVSTLGIRDHSRGVREYDTMAREGWSYGFFPSGKSFAAVHITNDDGPDMLAGFYFDGEQTYAIERYEVPDLVSAAGEPREYELHLGGDFGDITVTGAMDHAAPFALDHPIGQPIGWDPSNPDGTLIVEGPATPVLDGETGQGWLERVARASALGKS